MNIYLEDFKNELQNSINAFVTDAGWHVVHNQEDYPDPKRNHQILVCVLEKDTKNTYYTTAIYCRFNVLGEEEHVFIMDTQDDDDIVLAWKYIEEFHYDEGF